MRLLISLAVLIIISGCTTTRNVVVEQGNPLLQDEIAKVKGMNQNEVRDLLGPPQSRWNLDNEVWIYYQKFSNQDGEKSYSVEIQFNDSDIVEEVITNSKADD